MNTSASPAPSQTTRRSARSRSIWAVGLVLVAVLVFLQTRFGPAGVESRRAEEKVRQAEADLAAATEKRDLLNQKLLDLQAELVAARRRSERAATTPPPPPPSESQPPAPTPVMDR